MLNVDLKTCPKKVIKIESLRNFMRFCKKKLSLGDHQEMLVKRTLGSCEHTMIK